MTYAEIGGARAVGKVNAAVKAGRLAKPSVCDDCGRSASRIEGHHHRGYEAEHELDVVWLCAPCHRIRHGRRPSLPSWERGSRAYDAATGRHPMYGGSQAGHSFTDSSSPKRLLKVLRFLWLALRTDEERAAAHALIAEIEREHPL